jgi:hypothetical protein
MKFIKVIICLVMKSVGCQHILYTRQESAARFIVVATGTHINLTIITQ